MADYTIKEGDTRPTLRAALYDPNGVAVNLAGATVRFAMGVQPGSPLVAAPATIVDAANGIVEYAWVAGNTDTAGTFYGEFQVTFGDLTVESFPNDGYIQILVKAEMGA